MQLIFKSNFVCLYTEKEAIYMHWMLPDIPWKYLFTCTKMHADLTDSCIFNTSEWKLPKNLKLLTTDVLE